MTSSAKFWDRIAPRYARQAISDPSTYQRKLEITRTFFTPDSDVLEFGCGTGSTAILHAPYVKRYTATDLSGGMLKIAREKLNTQKLENLEFQQARLEQLDVAPNSLDAVLGLSVLHLIDDRQARIDDVYRMLKPGAVFISSTACLGDKMKWFKFVGPIVKWLRIAPKVSVFSADELVQELQAAGFEIEQQWRPEKAVAVFIVAKKPLD